MQNILTCRLSSSYNIATNLAIWIRCVSIYWAIVIFLRRHIVWRKFIFILLIRHVRLLTFAATLIPHCDWFFVVAVFQTLSKILSFFPQLHRNVCNLTGYANSNGGITGKLATPFLPFHWFSGIKWTTKTHTWKSEQNVIIVINLSFTLKYGISLIRHNLNNTIMVLYT